MPRTGRIVFVALGIALLLAWRVPQIITDARDGVPRDGTIVDYQPSATGRYQYAVVATERDGHPVQLRADRSWSFRWYRVGETVPILDLGGRHAAVGSFWVRYSDLLGYGLLLSVGVSLGFYSARMKRRAAQPASGS